MPTTPTAAEAARPARQARDLHCRIGLFTFTHKSDVPVLLAAVVLAIMSGVALPVLSWILGVVFDAFSDYGTGKVDVIMFRGRVTTYLIYLGGLGGASLFLNSTFFVAWAVFGDLQAKDAQDGLHLNLLHKPLSWYDEQDHGILAMLARLHAQIHDLQAATSQTLGFAVQHAVSTVTALGLAFYMCWDVTLVTLSTLPLIFFLLAWMSARMQPSMTKLEESLKAGAAVSANAIQGIDTVVCYNGQNTECERYRKLLDHINHHYDGVALWNALQIGAVRFITLLMFVQGFWYGTKVVMEGRKSAGQILTAFWACLVATQCLEQTLPLVSVLDRGCMAARLLAASMRDIETETLTNGGDGAGLEAPVKGEIVFYDVTFAYPSAVGSPVLSKATLTFAAGETTFLVGTTGSGKSSIVNLLLRFYEPDQGTISIDGQDIRSISLQNLRSNVFAIEQQPSLFNDTLSNNVTLKNPAEPRKNMRRILFSIAFAELREVLPTLPDELDTKLGPDGTSLSGGQRQRVFLARAKYRDPPILIVDEGTSALDSGCRTRVLEKLRWWRQMKTTIIITHDLSQIKDHDFVYVLNNGNVTHGAYWSELESINDLFSAAKNVESSPRAEEARSRSRPTSGLPSLSTNRNTRRRSDTSGNIETITWESTSEPRSPLLDSPWGVGRHLSNLSQLRKSTTYSTTTSKQLKENTSLELAEYQQGKHFVELDGVTSNARACGGSRNLETKETFSPPQVSLKTILRTVWPHLHSRQRQRLFAGLVCILVHAAATPAFALTFSKLLDFFLLPLDQDSTYALRWSIGIMGVAGCDALASYWMHRLMEGIGQAWVAELKLQGLRNVLHQPLSWFDSPGTSAPELSITLETSTDTIRSVLSRVVPFMTVSVLMTAIACVWSIAICWKLALVGIAVAPVFYALSRGFELVSSAWERRRIAAIQEVVALFGETFVNIRTVKAMSMETHFGDKCLAATRDVRRIGLRKALASGVLFGAAEASSTLVTALVFWYGSVLVASAEASVSDVAAVFTMLLISLANANANLASIPQVAAARAAGSRLMRLGNLTVTNPQEEKGHVRLSRLPGPIRFTDLSFRYPSRPQNEVLSSFNMEIEPGTSVGIVGPSGSGKSTVLSLVLGLYSASTPEQVPECQPGGARSSIGSGQDRSLTIGDIPYSACHIQSLRALIGYVPQDVLLFPGTIAENIAYGLGLRSRAASGGAVQWAAGLAGIDGFVCGLLEGYNTRVGDGGVGLSGGQRQMVGIARALARKPQLVVMDEPTRNLDPGSAAVVRDTIRKLVALGVTVVVATHSREMMETLDQLVDLGQVAGEDEDSRVERAEETAEDAALTYAVRARLAHRICY